MTFVYRCPKCGATLRYHAFNPYPELPPCEACAPRMELIEETSSAQEVEE